MELNRETMFEYEWKCAWGDADPHGIAYYPNLIDAMHRTRSI
jgi:4-hydroxybenzoyl-CoA thioesterase